MNEITLKEAIYCYSLCLITLLHKAHMKATNELHVTTEYSPGPAAIINSRPTHDPANATGYLLRQISGRLRINNGALVSHQISEMFTTLAVNPNIGQRIRNLKRFLRTQHKAFIHHRDLYSTP